MQCDLYLATTAKEFQDDCCTENSLLFDSLYRLWLGIDHAQSEGSLRRGEDARALEQRFHAAVPGYPLCTRS